MLNSFNSEYVEVDINLVKAQKYLSKLKELVSKTCQPVYGSKVLVYNIPEFLNLSNLFSSSSDVDDLKNKALDVKTQTEKDIFEYLLMRKDLEKLKNDIFRINGEFGLDYILSEIEILSSHKLSLITLLKNSKGKSDLKLVENVFKNYKEVIITGTTFDFPYLKTFSDDEINTEIKKISKKLNILEDERDKLNATKNIKIRVSKQTADLLGL
jgi:hypothetical protein